MRIIEDIEKTCRSCRVCAEHQDAPPKEPLHPHKVPTKVRQSLTSDMFEVNGRQFFLTVDRYSKYPVLDEIRTISSRAITQKMETCMSMFGRPDEILTDNGPQYTGQPFQDITKSWGRKHITSSPHNAKSNGFAERHVRHIKSTVKKVLEHGGNLQVVLLQIRATPIDSKLPSPAELLFGRPITTLLPSRSEPGKEAHRLQLEQRSTNMKEQHDKTSGRELPPLHPGQHVTVLHPERKTWYPATIVKKCSEPRSYIVQTPNGNQVRRCRRHLRELFRPHQGTDMEISTTETNPGERQHFSVSVKDKTDQVTDTIPQLEEEKSLEADKSMLQTRTRRGRVISRPAYYNDFV
uniref:Integrase catalytic domain-containing protein n=1 Tax=Nothobranchius furzeri TaxID=105023 RepID=A0A8C6LCP7_NOTFU